MKGVILTPSETPLVLFLGISGLVSVDCLVLADTNDLLPLLWWMIDNKAANLSDG